MDFQEAQCGIITTIFGITTHFPSCPLAYCGLFQFAEAYSMLTYNSGSLNVKYIGEAVIFDYFERSNM